MTHAVTPDGQPDGQPDDRLVRLVEIWHHACTDFVALAREIPPEQWQLPTDLDGWCVKDNVAHTAHLEAVLAGAPEETLAVAEAPHLSSPTSFYTEQGVLARRDRDMETLTAELEQAVAARYSALQAEPPTDPKAAPPKTPGDAPWDFQTLLNNRPVDVWMHEQDIRRAIRRPGGYDSPVADHVLRTLGRSLSMVVGKRVSPPIGTTVRLEVPEAGLSWSARVGDDGRAAPVDDDVEATTTVTLSPEDFVVLAGGRRPPSATQPLIAGDEELGQRLLESMAVTP
jgi:uncharacterized protein (TIGR03083 family)